MLLQYRYLWLRERRAEVKLPSKVKSSKKEVSPPCQKKNQKLAPKARQEWQSPHREKSSLVVCVQSPEVEVAQVTKLKQPLTPNET